MRAGRAARVTRMKLLTPRKQLLTPGSNLLLRTVFEYEFSFFLLNFKYLFLLKRVLDCLSSSRSVSFLLERGFSVHVKYSYEKSDRMKFLDLVKDRDVLRPEEEAKILKPYACVYKVK